MKIMPQEIVNNLHSPKITRSHSRTSVVCAVLALSLIAVFTLKQTWWTFFLLAEMSLAVGIVELLARNLPKQMRRQIRSNSQRSDGSRSSKRQQLEKSAIRRFKLNTLVCFAFALIPMHACWLTYCFFIPQINRFSEQYAPSAKYQWTETLLEPALHIAVLLIVFAILTYDSLKAIYLTTLKQLDDEVCRRAENYAVYDLVNPPDQQSERFKSA